MEFLYEAIVMGFLTLNNRFCCPQYSIKFDSGKPDWRCPDFVVLDFDTPQVIIAEVTTASNLGDFVAKAIELHEHGSRRIREELTDRAKSTIPTIAEWPIVIQLFVREDRKDALEETLQSRKLQFSVFTLEQAFQRWKPVPVNGPQ